PDEFDGFYMDTTGKNLKRFRVASAEESAERAGDMGDRAGWIDIDVFASGESPGPGAVEQGDEVMAKISTMGRGRSRKAPATLKEAQVRLRKANSLILKESRVERRGPGGLILTEVEPSEEVKIDTADLPNPIHLGGISIRYYEKGSQND